jgi:hypothetical protein
MSVELAREIIVLVVFAVGITSTISSSTIAAEVEEALPGAGDNDENNNIIATT